MDPSPNILRDIINQGDTQNVNFLSFLRELSVLEFNLSAIPQTSRTIHYYEQNDLLMEKREARGTWKKYSTEDVIWLHVIMSLREFGLPITKMKKVKAFLMRITYRDEQTRIKHGILTTLAASAFTDLYKYYLLVYGDGQCWLTNSSGFFRNQFYDHLQVSCIIIPLNEVFAHVHEQLYDEPIREAIVQDIEISSQVKKIMDILLVDDYKELIIEYKDKKPKRIKITKSVDVSKKMEQVLSERDFIDIKVVKAGGKKVSLEKSWKENL